MSLSVVIPVLNGGRFIATAISSLLNSPVDEILVMDGGSSDGTLDIVKSFSRRDCRVDFFSGSDSGPADAINRGFSIARGTILSWLNSDDFVCDGAIDRALKAFSMPNSPVMVYGGANIVDVDGDFVSKYPVRLPSVGIEGFWDGCFICQPTVYFKRSAWVVLGALDVSLKTSFDFEYWIRFFQVFHERIHFIPDCQAASRSHSETITARFRRDVCLEALKILSACFGHAPVHWIFNHIREMNFLSPEDRYFYCDSLLHDARCYLRDEDFILLKQQF